MANQTIAKTLGFLGIWRYSFMEFPTLLHLIIIIIIMF
jgi:hypothetical protein